MTDQITVPTTPARPVKLPDTLWELTELALNDLKAARRIRRYEIMMSTWHRPNYNDYGKCSICAAGSVMAITLGCDPGERLTPSSFDDDTQRKLEAINELRQGYVSGAYPYIANKFSWDSDPDTVAAIQRHEKFDRYVPEFNPYDPRPFYRAMEKLAADLKEAGL